MLIKNCDEAITVCPLIVKLRSDELIANNRLRIGYEITSRFILRLPARSSVAPRLCSLATPRFGYKRLLRHLGMWRIPADLSKSGSYSVPDPYLPCVGVFRAFEFDRSGEYLTFCPSVSVSSFSSSAVAMTTSGCFFLILSTRMKA
jgi:hypothetical protein